MLDAACELTVLAGPEPVLCMAYVVPVGKVSTHLSSTVLVAKLTADVRFAVDANCA